MTVFGWVKLLRENNPDILNDLGVDLNGNGTVDGNESADTNGDGRILEDEARKYCIEHQQTLMSSNPVLRAAVDSGFSLSNPIHDTIMREYGVSDGPMSTQIILNSYANLGNIFRNYMSILTSHSSEGVLSASPDHLMEWVSDAFLAGGAQFASTGSTLFTTDAANNMFDCDTSTRVLMGIAYEFGWPIHAVALPGHIFARWQLDDGRWINFEVQEQAETAYGTHFLKNSFYAEWKDLDQTAIGNGTYLSNLTPEEWEGAALYNIAYNRLAQFTNTIEGLGNLFSEDLTKLSLKKIKEIDPSQINVAVLDEVIGFMEKLIMPVAGRSPSAYALLAIAYMIKGYATGDSASYNAAINALSRRMELDPSINTLVSRVTRAELYEATGNYQAALDDLDAVLAEVPSAEYFAQRQAVLMGLGYYEAADANMFSLVHALKHPPQTAIDGNATASDGVGPSGTPAGEEAPVIFEMEDWNDMSFYDRGTAYLSMGHYEKAKVVFLQGLVQDPDNAQLLAGVANCELELHRYERAIDYATRAIEMDVSSALAHEVRAAAYTSIADANMRKGESIESQRSLYEKAIEDASYSETSASYTMSAHASLQLGDLSNARLYYQMAITINPDNVQALAELGLLEARHGDFEHPATGDLKRGYEAAFKALVLSPYDRTTLLACALITKRLGYYEAAARYSKALLELEPDNSEATTIYAEAVAASANA